MPHPCPHHCPPGGGGGLAGGAGILALAVLAAAVARPVIHAAQIALQIVLITAGCLAAGGLVAVAAVVALRLRRRQLAARPPMRLVRSRPVAPLSAPQQAIGARRTLPAATAVHREHIPRVP